MKKNKKLLLLLLLLLGAGGISAGVAIPLTMSKKTETKVEGVDWTVIGDATKIVSWDKELPSSQIYKHKNDDGTYTTNITDSLGYVAPVAGANGATADLSVVLSTGNAGDSVNIDGTTYTIENEGLSWSPALPSGDHYIKAGTTDEYTSDITLGEGYVAGTPGANPSITLSDGTVVELPSDGGTTEAVSKYTYVETDPGAAEKTVRTDWITFKAEVYGNVLIQELELSTTGADYDKALYIYEPVSSLSSEYVGMKFSYNGAQYVELLFNENFASGGDYTGALPVNGDEPSTFVSYTKGSNEAAPEVPAKFTISYDGVELATNVEFPFGSTPTGAPTGSTYDAGAAGTGNNPSVATLPAVSNEGDAVVIDGATSTVVSGQNSWSTTLPSGTTYVLASDETKYTSDESKAKDYVAGVEEVIASSSKVSAEELITAAEANSTKITIDGVEYIYA